MASLDRQRLKRLLPYLGRDRRRLILSLLMLIPLALAGAVQPLLVGQAISVLRHEPRLPWLANLAVPVALRLLVGLLLVAVLLRLALQGTQSFNVQVVGQRLTARIRADLFRLAVAKGWLLLELSREAQALEDVFRDLTLGDERKNRELSAA